MTSLSKKIGRNTFFNILGKFWFVGVNLALVPFIISTLGTEVYGIWVLVMVINNAFVVFDFGISASITKHISEYLAIEDFKKINTIISTGIFFFFAISSIFIIGVYLLLPWLTIHAFNLPPHLMSQGFFVLKLGLLSFFFGGLANIFQSIIFGAQRMGIANAIAIGVSVLQTAGIVFVLLAGFGLAGLVINLIVANFVLAFGMFLGSHKIISTLQIKLRFVTKEAFRLLFSFGSKLQVGTATAFLTEHINKVILSAFAGLQAVVYFDVAMKVVNLVRVLPLLLISAVMPSVSELYATGDNDRLRALYFRGTKYLASVVIPIASITILAASPAVAFLLQEHSGIAALSVQILAVTYAINLFTGMGTTVARGIGKPELEMYYALLIAILNIILVYSLGDRFGYFGIVSGMAISIIAGSLYFLVFFHKKTKKILGKVDRDMNKGLLLLLLPTVFFIAINFLFEAFQLPPQRNAQLQPWFAILLFIVFYTFMLFKSKFFDEYDRNLIRSVIRIK
jgi:O-antigen/teichoic acid export membrane protein